MSGKDYKGGDIRMPNTTYDKLCRYDDKLLAWMWIERTRNYATGMPTVSVRKLALKYGWGVSKSHRFIVEHFRNTSGTPTPHEQGADKDKRNKSGTLVEHPDPETTLYTKKQKTKLHKYIPPEWVPIETWNAWMLVRPKSASTSELAMSRIVNALRELKERGFDLVEILGDAETGTWKGIKSKWFTDELKQKPGTIEVNMDAINRAMGNKNGIT